MQEVTAKPVRVSLPADEVWAKLSDLSKAHLYVPGLTGTEITTDNATGVGASRKVLSKRPPMDETVIEWNEGEGFLLRLHFGDRHAWGPFKEAFYRYGIRPEPNGSGTMLENSMSFELKGGAIGRLLGNGLIKKGLAGSLRDVTLAQSLYYENGEQVSPAMLKAAKAGAANA